MANPILSGSLRLLSALGGSELAERYGLHERAKQLVESGARRGAAWLRERGEKARAEGGEKARDGSRKIDLTPTEAQELVRSAVRRFAEQAVRPRAAAADEALAPPAELLVEAAELALVALAIPEAYGGAADERSVVTFTLVAEELARGDLALALALLAPVSAANLVHDLGTDAQREAWLPRFAREGFYPATTAMLEPRPLFDPRAPRTVAKPRGGGGYRLRGEKSLVALGRSARAFVVYAKVEGEPRSCFIVEGDREGVEVRSEPAMGLRGADLCTVRFDVELPPEARLAREGVDTQRAIDLGRIGWGALTVGQGQAVLEHVIAYCNERVAFGEPITHRQSVAFLIADLAIELEALRLMTWRAAARADRGWRFTKQAHLVKAQAGAKAAKIGSDGVQLLGGAGFLREHPVERWYRHLAAVELMEGGVAL